MSIKTGTNVVLTSKVGNVEIEGTLAQSTSAFDTFFYVTPKGGNAYSAFRMSDFSLAEVVEPIVLPTGRNAVVAIGKNVYRKSGAGYQVWGLWNGLTRTNAELTAKANAKADQYRVVFEGE